METFGHIFLEVDAGEADILVLGGDGFLGVLRIGQVVEGNAAAEAEGQIVLADLVVLRHVGVEIVFPVELAGVRNFATEHEAGQDGEPQGLVVHHGERAGEAEADGADVGVRLAAVFDRAGAEHLSAGLELDVNFEADGGDVTGIHGTPNFH